jgi:hypothetical protein
MAFLISSVGDSTTPSVVPGHGVVLTTDTHSIPQLVGGSQEVPSPSKFTGMRQIAHSLVDGRRFIPVGAALTAAALVSGCATSTNGSAARPTDGTPAPHAIDVTRLDVGDYPIRPRPPLGAAGSPERGAIVEGQRMANYVLGPWEVDPDLFRGGFTPSANGYSSSANLVTPPVQGQKYFSPVPWVDSSQFRTIVAQHHFIVGFHTVRKVSSNQLLWHDVLRFVDGPAATAAATEISAAAREGSDVHAVPVTAVEIPGHPDAVAATHRYEDSADDVVTIPGFESPDDLRKYTAVRSVIAHGPYVLMDEARAPNVSPDGVETARAMVGKTIDLQIPLIDTFQATDPAKFGVHCTFNTNRYSSRQR